ncbi:MAG: hypothetical protein GY898_00300 [Proteobacteria bacterium]|nr:hypothetical protein [Pseudomonadota bacterium]
MLDPKNDSIDDIGPVGSTLLTRLGGGIMMVAALLTALAGALIMLTSVIYTPWMKPAPYAMLGLGILGMPFAAGIMNARDWAAIGGVFLMGGIALLNLVFNLWAAINRGFYSWSFFAMMASLVGAVLVPLAIKDCLVASKNRRKLLEGV